MRKHFADLKIGERFKKGNKVVEKIEPVYESGAKVRGRFRGNCRNVETGNLIRGNFAMVEVVEND